MRRVLLALVTAAAALGPAAAAEPDGSADRLLSELRSDTLAVRAEAARALKDSADLTDDAVRAALRTAPTAARAALLGVIAARGMQPLAPDAVALCLDAEPLVADAAVRALVTLGEEAVKAGVVRLGSSDDPEAPARKRHLLALSEQSKVETALLARWRRKGGSYEGRYRSLASLGYSVQPVLFAMLLDVPLADHHVIVPETTDAEARFTLQALAIHEIRNSNRRGYVTFAPLPLTIEPSELFDLASQALKDVGDGRLLGDVLEGLADKLDEVDQRAGFRLRRIEKGYCRAIEEILFAIGLKERLYRRCEEQGDEVDRARRQTFGSVDGEAYLSQELSEYGSLLHQVQQYEESAAAFAEVVRLGVRSGGKEPSLAGYNRACALARAGKKDEALRQLARSLDPRFASGLDDLTAEWVTEDGDLESLRSDARYKEIIKKRFGE